jgi:DNA polymerase III epsilon subunit-like protein
VFAEMLARQDATARNRELELRMIKETVGGLFDLMKPHFDGFPNNYMVFDLETTGLEPRRDLAMQIGFCLVKDGVPVEKMGVIIDWTKLPSFLPKTKYQLFREKLEKVKHHVEFKNGVPTGKKYQISFERMQDEGVHPITALELFHDLFVETRKQRRFFIAHNGYHFDVPFMEGHFDVFLGARAKEFNIEERPPFYFADNELFDTGMVEKGSQCQMSPWSNDTVRSWSLRTHNERIRNVRWALDTACVPRYGLKEKHNLDLDSAHDAGFDCYVCHLLFQEYLRIKDGGKEPDPIYQTANVPRGAPTPLPPWE